MDEILLTEELRVLLIRREQIATGLSGLSPAAAIREASRILRAERTKIDTDIIAIVGSADLVVFHPGGEVVAQIINVPEKTTTRKAYRKVELRCIEFNKRRARARKKEKSK